MRSPSGVTVVVLRMLLSLVYFRRAAAAPRPACPNTCFCNALNRIVYCSRRGLAAIPDAIPGDTLQLNLNANAFRSSTIGRRNFSSNVALQHLYMSDCGLESLEVDTFLDLVDLRWLDLSNNRLQVRRRGCAFRCSNVFAVYFNSRHIFMLTFFYFLQRFYVKKVKNGIHVL